MCLLIKLPCEGKIENKFRTDLPAKDPTYWWDDNFTLILHIPRHTWIHITNIIIRGTRHCEVFHFERHWKFMINILTFYMKTSSTVTSKSYSLCLIKETFTVSQQHKTNPTTSKHPVTSIWSWKCTARHLPQWTQATLVRYMQGERESCPQFFSFV